jgi:Fe-S cluster assembly iron-binding protein IscA
MTDSYPRIFLGPEPIDTHLSVSSPAAQAIHQALLSNQLDPTKYGLRIRVVAWKGFTPLYALSHDKATDADVVFATRVARVIVDRATLRWINDATLEYDDRDKAFRIVAARVDLRQHHQCGTPRGI